MDNESEETKEKNYYQTYKIKSNKENLFDIEMLINENEELVFYTTKFEGKIRFEFTNNFSFETLNKIKIFRAADNNYEIFDSLNEIIDYSVFKNNPPFIEENTNLFILHIPNKNISFEIPVKEKSDREMIEDLVIKINDLEYSDKNKEKKINDIINVVDEIKNRLNKKDEEIEELKNNINQKIEEKNSYESENNKNIENINSKIKENYDKIEKINNKISNLDLQFIEINYKIINFNKNSENSEKLFNENINSINQKNENLNEKIIENKNFFEKINNENIKNINMINNKTIKFDEFKNEITNNLKEYKNEQEILTEDSKKIKNNQNFLTNEINALQSKIDNLKDLKNNQDFLTGEIESLQTKIDKITKVLNNVQNNQINTITLILPSSNPMNNLLKSLIEKNYIKTQKVLNCMLQVDRKDFINTKPYEDKPQYVSHNVTISAPHMHAFALEKLSPFLTEGINVLDIGSGTGYL